jgi:hypothetical protein
METGLAKLWALEVIGLSSEEMANIRWRNAARIFPEGSLPGIPSIGADLRIATEAEGAAS